MSALAPSRLYPIFKAFIAVVLALALVDLLLGAVFGIHPAGMPPPFDPAAITRLSGRIAVFEKMEAAGDVRDDQVVAVIGISTVQEDLDPTILAANDAQRRKWLVLGDAGHNLTHLCVYIRPLLASAVRPRLVVLGIHQFMLRSDDRDSPSEVVGTSAVIQHLRHLQLRELARDIIWLDRNHHRLEDETNLLVARATDWVRRAFALPMYDWYPIDSHPGGAWTIHVRRAPADYLTQQWEGFGRALKPDQFPVHNGQAEALQSLVDQLRARGSVVMCVLMPESSQLRDLAPPIVATRFSEAVARTSTPQAPLRVIDLRDSMPDELFRDYAHLNDEGRSRFSALLGERLSDEPRAK